jgi:dienelactone hydrolase
MSGGGYSIERHFANYFANRGYAAVIVHRDKIPKNLQLLENLNPMMKRMVLDHKRVIDWLEAQKDVDAGKIGIFGISLGGIKGAILTPLENRIQAAIIGLAGGDVPHILVHTTEPGLVKKREDYLKQHNLTLEQAEERLRKMVTRDPLVYAPYVDPNKVMLVIARYDTVVPTEKCLLLKEKMGNPETIMLPSGHYTAALSIPYIKSEAFDFFEKRFNGTAGKIVSRSSGGLTRIQAGPR